MTECPTCRLAMESHSTMELMECCMRQLPANLDEDGRAVCPECMHDLEGHSEENLAECMIAFLESGT